MVGYDSVFFSMNSEVAAKLCSFAGTFAESDLANNYLAGFDFFTTIELNAKPLAGAVMDIFGGTASFYM